MLSVGPGSVLITWPAGMVSSKLRAVTRIENPSARALAAASSSGSSMRRGAAV
jgi:hypothetical protein